MSNSHDPVAATEQASAAMRALARATRSLDDPADAAWAVGGLLSIASAFIETLDHLASVHRGHIELAHDDRGRRTAGRGLGLTAASNLHRAALMQTEAFQRLNLALQYSAQISWYPDRPTRLAHAAPAFAGGRAASSAQTIRPAPEPAGPSL